jgi:flagellar hook-associated protein 3 FlgL
MRITNNTVFLNLQRQIDLSGNQLIRSEEVVSTQKNINRMSDNPVDAGRVLSLKARLANAGQYANNIDQANGLASVQDQSLGQVVDLIGQAKALLLGETNEVSSTAATRESARIQTAMLASQLVQLGNTQYNGDYIYSGFATSTPAFANPAVNAAAGAVAGGETAVATQVTDVTSLTYDNYQIQFTAPGVFDFIDTTAGQTVLSNQAYVSGQPIGFAGMQVTIADGATGPQAGDVFNVSASTPGTYQGDSQIQQVEIQPGQTIAQNLTGDRVFQGAGVAGGVDIFDTLNQIGVALKNNDRTAMDQLLAKLDAAQTQVSNFRSNVGARMNLLDQVKDRNDNIKLQLDSLRSGLEDADMAQAISEMNKQQNGYQATLGAAAKIAQLSLLDFLR